MQIIPPTLRMFGVEDRRPSKGLLLQRLLLRLMGGIPLVQVYLLLLFSVSF